MNPTNGLGRTYIHICNHTYTLKHKKTGTIDFVLLWVTEKENSEGGLKLKVINIGTPVE